MYLGKNFCREKNKPNKRTEKIINNSNIGSSIWISEKKLPIIVETINIEIGVIFFIARYAIIEVNIKKIKWSIPIIGCAIPDKSPSSMLLGFSLSIKWCANVIFDTIKIAKHLIRNKYVLFGKIFTSGPNDDLFTWLNWISL